MNQILARISAIAGKEWRLNLRFPMEYVAANLVGPLKSAVLMYFIYRGLLKESGAKFGVLDNDNFQIFVIIGTTCHSLFMASLSTFRQKMVSEKYWQTITGTLVSPASILEVILGFIIGSVAIHLVIALLTLTFATVLFALPVTTLLSSLLPLLLLSLMGFGIGLVGTTFSLVWEGKAFYFDYFVQLLIFMSCFYYPIQTLPEVAHPMVKLLPTYQAAQMVQSAFLGTASIGGHEMLLYLIAVSVLTLCLPALLMEYALKRFGVVGY